jgi:hypothetical protein
MAAQYDDEEPIDERTSVRLPLAPGRYRIELQQFPDRLDLIVQPASPEEALSPPTAVPWRNE